MWLVDALIALAAAGAIPSTAGATLSKPRAVGLVAAARLGVDPDQVDLPTLVGAFDAASVRAVWRGLPGAERAGIVEYLAERHGPAVAVFAALAERHDDVLAELLVTQAITSAPGTDTHAAAALGGFLQARFVAPRPSRIDLAAAGAAAVVYAADAPSARLGQQVRHAERELEELGAPELAVHSPILPRGFVERLAVAAQRLDEAAIADVVTHQQAPRERHRVDRLRAAVRLHRWLKSASVPQYATASEGVAHHAGELAWVDRALSQVRAGDADPRVATVLRRIERRAAEVRGGADAAFAARLAADATTPAEVLAVETVLPALVVPLVRSGPVLLVVVDGMSGAVAGDLTDAITDRRTGWTEIVRSGTGAREAVLAALPTETAFSRTSLFCAALRTGDAKVERSAFGAHRFWPGGGAVLVHKSGVAGRDGDDLGAELEEALGPEGPAGRRRRPQHRGRRAGEGAPVDRPCLAARGRRRAAAAAGSGRCRGPDGCPDQRSRPRSRARLRVPSAAGRRRAVASRRRRTAGDGEVVVDGPRVLTPEGRAILAATRGAAVRRAGTRLPRRRHARRGRDPAGGAATSGYRRARRPGSAPPAAAGAGGRARRRLARRRPRSPPEGRPGGQPPARARRPVRPPHGARSAAVVRLVRSSDFAERRTARSPRIVYPLRACSRPWSTRSSPPAAGCRLADVAERGGQRPVATRAVWSAALGRVLNRDSFPVLTLVRRRPRGRTRRCAARRAVPAGRR